MIRKAFTHAFALLTLFALIASAGGSGGALLGTAGLSLAPQPALAGDDQGDDDDDSGNSGNRGNNENKDDKEKKENNGNRGEDKKDDKVKAARVITIAPVCTFDSVADQTICTFTADLGVGESGARRILIPEELVCAETRATSPALLIGGPGSISGDDDDDGADDDDNGAGDDDDSAGTPLGAATLTLAGDVSPGDVAVTYFVETDAGLFPALGQRLVCAPVEAAAPLPTATPPSDISDSLGAIVVFAFDCGPVTDMSTFDWFGRCAPAAAPGPFEVSQWNGTTFEPVAEATTDAAGTLQFPRLEPGRFELHEPGTSWCHAESDSVNAQGEVIVAAGQRATVWTFHCEAPTTFALVAPTPVK